jgi:endonuclease YncB( thermonuclease family)
VFIETTEGRSVVDVGFGLLREVPSRNIEGLAPGTVVESRIENEGPVLVESLRTTTDLYTYRAYLDYVIDGDTIVLYVDLGFETYSRQKLRLRGIDTPEIATTEGENAKTFVEEILKRSKTITIKTYRKDKYDRYLADVFVGSKEIFLNQQLLDEKLAVAY